MSQAKKNTEPVTRADIENKLAEIDAAIVETTKSSKDMAKLAIGIGIIAIAGIAFFSGRRKALRPKTIVSFTKLRK